MVDTILIAEDEPVQRRILTTMLTKKLGYQTIAAENGRQIMKHLQASNIGDIRAVILDLDMPEMDGFETLQALRQYRPDLPVLILTSHDETAAAVAAIKQGASDFLIKPADAVQLDVAIKNAIRLSTLSRELTKFKRDREGALGFSDLIGHEAGLAEVISYASKAALSDVPVLITGETSTGKELLARAIHGESKRIGAPFVAVHCNALSPQSMDAVLFGQEKNAAVSAKIPGKFREAERGTIFIDEVHALSAEAQAKLLRIIQHREIEPAGTSTPIKLNVRIISATDRNLKELVQAGQFREDLYFQLNVLSIHMPSLQERRDDILPLAEYFLRLFSSLDALPLKSLTPNARRYLLDYTWPGNMRELEGLIHRALVLSEQDTIDRDLLLKIHASEPDIPGAPAGAFITLKKANGLPKTMAEIEAEAMEKTLEHYQHNISRAAEALGMAKSTFYRKRK